MSEPAVPTPEVFRTRGGNRRRLTQAGQTEIERLTALGEASGWLSPLAYNLTISHSHRFVWYRVAKVATRTIRHHCETHGVSLDVDHAEKSGEHAGKVMAGADEPYDYTPFFWSDILDYGYEAIGETSSRLDMVEDWKDGQVGTGVVYYLKSGAVRGVLLWNVWDSVDQARSLIAETARTPIEDVESLRGRIPFG